MSSARVKNSTNVRLELARFGVGVAQGVSPSLAARVAEEIFVSPRRRPRPAREAAWLAAATPFSFAACARSVAAWAWGGEDRPAILLVHGWEGRGGQLGAFAAPLLAAGFRVVTFDAPAHGATSGQQMTLMDLTRTILAAAGRVGPLHGVVAHSFGAAALTVALARGLPVARAAFVAPVVDVLASVRRFAYWARLGAEAEAELRRRVERRNGAPIEEVDALGLAGAMRTPLLVVHDREDRQVPFADAQAVVERWPEARLHATEGLGHDRILREPDVVRRVTAHLGVGAGVLTLQEELERELFDRTLRQVG